MQKFIVTMNDDVEYSLLSENALTAVAFASEKLYEKAIDFGAFNSVYVRVEPYDPDTHCEFELYEELL